MTYRGEGNWLIAIAPYFFPTAAVGVLAASLFVPESWGDVVEAILGISLGYHIVSTAQETHRGQTDLALVGWPFAMLFLPTAKLVGLGAVVSFAMDGRNGLSEFFSLLK